LRGINAVPFVPVIDPFPYGLLTTVVSLEAILLSIFVLISQNRMSRAADRRTHLDLQINVLAEQEITAVLKMVREIHDHLGIASEVDDKEIDRHSEATDLKHLSTALDRRLPQG
jgi:uncharacterized membrane protein